MKNYGEIPGGKQELRNLLYPFYEFYPLKLWSKYRWWRNKKLKHKLKILNSKSKWLTVINRLGARGDTLITANVIRCIKERYENLKINCISPYPELIKYDPAIDSINASETFYSFDSSYFELLVRNEQNENVVEHNLKRLGISTFFYKSAYFLIESEVNWAKNQVINFKKPLIAISTRSKDHIKNWPTKNWAAIIEEIKKEFCIIQLGDESEPTFENVTRFAGRCTMRQSAALLSQCKLFVGPDSLLMHIANGLDLKSIIIFGNARPVNCLGYSENINLTGPNPKQTSWIHQGHEGDNEKLDCITNIPSREVMNHINRMSFN